MRMAQNKFRRVIFSFAVMLIIAVLVAGVSVFWQLQNVSNLHHGNFVLSNADAAEEIYYTCPMHPTIVQENPGSCPICGMDLVKEKAAGSDHDGHTHASAEEIAGQTLFTCGMHPNVIQEEPGTCPICGMDLTAMEKPAASEGKNKTAKGVVLVDPVMVQNMGVRVAEVKRVPIFRHVRTIGEVDVAENEISVVNLRFSGWVEKIWVDSTGEKIKKGQWLFSIYSPELVSAQKEYLLSYNTTGATSELTKSAAERLRLWNISDSVLNKIISQQNVSRNHIITAPESGYVLRKNVVAGARVKAGADLYRIGNLDRIWVTAEVYEYDAPWIKLKQPAKMELSFQQGRQYDGQVAYIYPTLNRKSRTLKVRLEFENPAVLLKPGMFATIRIEAQRKDNVLAIPTEAIIHSGQRNLVFVSSEIGKYQPREIVTGLVGDNHLTEVLSGLEESETVVTSGQFLLDSESQLQEAVQKLLAERLQAKKTGKHRRDADPGSRDDGHKHNKDGSGTTSYMTCPMHPQIVQDEAGDCPICGMDLVEKKR